MHATIDLVLQLAAALVREPARLIKAHEFRSRRGVLAVPVHAHDDWLQLDVAIRCAGAWRVDGEPASIDGPTLAAFYPRQAHGYDLAMHAEARVYSVKLRVDRAWPAIRRRVLASHQVQCRGAAAATTIQRLIRRTLATRPHLPTIAGDLAALLACWPLRQDGSAGPGADPAVEAAMSHLDENLHRRPSASELSCVAHVCPRQLGRRFQAAIGLSPRAYADRRRRALAEDMLRHGDASVTQIASLLGFASIHAFSRWFRMETGLAPSRFARQHGSL